MCEREAFSVRGIDMFRNIFSNIGCKKGKVDPSIIIAIVIIVIIASVVIYAILSSAKI